MKEIAAEKPKDEQESVIWGKRLSPEGTQEYEEAKSKTILSINNLLKEKFDPSNRDQIKALTRWCDNFEFNLNAMYLYQGMAAGLVPGMLWFATRVLPVPEAFAYFFSAFIYIGLIGALMEKVSFKDFQEERKRMEKIYNWCLKEGQKEYKASMDNTRQLNLPEVQRLMILLAPITPAEKMRAWPEIETSEEEKSIAQKVRWRVHTLFYSNTDLSLNSPDKIKLLQLQIKNGAFTLSTMEGCQQAFAYFQKLEPLKTAALGILKVPYIALREIIPEVIGAMLTPHKAP